jgi:[ribosomal protein S5]-alanine N-acetyltransferase
MGFFPFSEHDKPLLQRIFQNDEVMKWTLDDVYTDQALAAYLRRILANNSSTQRMQYEYKVYEESLFIGFADFEIIRACPIGGIAEIGYLIVPEMWGKGYGTRICRTLIEICFQQLNLHKVVASCSEDNIGSWKIMEKCGMSREGRFLNHRYTQKKFVNELKYGLVNPKICNISA